MAEDALFDFDAVSPLGDVLRDHGMKLVEAATDDQGRNVVDQAIRTHGEMYDTVTANDIRDRLPPERSSLIGSRFLALARQGKLERTGYTKATHAAGRGHVIAVWRWLG